MNRDHKYMILETSSRLKISIDDTDTDMSEKCWTFSNMYQLSAQPWNDTDDAQDSDRIMCMMQLKIYQSDIKAIEESALERRKDRKNGDNYRPNIISCQSVLIRYLASSSANPRRRKQRIDRTDRV